MDLVMYSAEMNRFTFWHVQKANFQTFRKMWSARGWEVIGEL